jgi:hypothetical protein
MIAVAHNLLDLLGGGLSVTDLEGLPWLSWKRHSAPLVVALGRTQVTLFQRSNRHTSSL